MLSRDLAHPNILRVYHLGSSGGRRYLTMQWVDGPTLDQILHEEGALREPVVVHVAIKLAAALEAAHARQVLHRDIKPQNVLLDSSGEPTGPSLLADATAADLAAIRDQLALDEILRPGPGPTRPPATCAPSSACAISPSSATRSGAS